VPVPVVHLQNRPERLDAGVREDDVGTAHSLSMRSAADLTAPMSRWSAVMDSQRAPAS
jgi:hypothetical protein